MAPIVESVEIARRPEDVFAYVTDPLEVALSNASNFASCSRPVITIAPVAFCTGSAASAACGIAVSAMLAIATATIVLPASFVSLFLIVPNPFWLCAATFRSASQRENCSASRVQAASTPRQ